ncbi:MAG: GtrA family protein [Clostridia bacterium]|nr:GtrA family protein [Clostridia bacterium]
MVFCSLVNRIKKHRLLSELFTEKGLQQFKKYVIVGLSCFAIEYLMFLAFLDIIKLEKFSANVIVYSIMFWFNFILNRVWSFESKDAFLKQLLMYGILFLFNQVVGNIGIMYVLTDVFLIHAKISKVLIMGVIVIWNFIIYKKIIYK